MSWIVRVLVVDTGTFRLNEWYNSLQQLLDLKIHMKETVGRVVLVGFGIVVLSIKKIMFKKMQLKKITVKEDHIKEKWLNKRMKS